MCGEVEPRLCDRLVVVVQVIRGEHSTGLCMMMPVPEQTEKVDPYRNYTSEKDLERINTNSEQMSMCCYYYGALTSLDAKLLLKNAKVGTFLIRDSSDPKYLYSLSLKTERGTTSVRIEYSHGLFRLDCEDRLRSKMPRFLSVMQLIDHYVRLSQSDDSKHCRWLESSGRRDMPVKLTKPRIGTVPCLQHLARLTINKCVRIEKLDTLGFPPRLTNFIREYPYPH